LDTVFVWGRHGRSHAEGVTRRSLGTRGKSCHPFPHGLKMPSQPPPPRPCDCLSQVDFLTRQLALIFIIDNKEAPLLKKSACACALRSGWLARFLWTNSRPAHGLM
jgi:hypothetical protein